MSELQATIVFEKTWEAINESCPENCGNEIGGEESSLYRNKCSWCGGSGRKYRYIVHEGSSRSSKTYSIIDTLYLYARGNRNKRLTIWRDTKTDCKKTVLNDIKKHLGITNRWLNGFLFNKTESILGFRNNSTMEIHGTDDENTVHGLTQDCAWLNEPYKISEATFDQIDQRTSDFIIIDWNPKMQLNWIEKTKNNKRALVIHSTYLDNPFCPEESRNKILSYKSVNFADAVVSGMKTAKQIRDGDYEGLTEKQIEDAVMCLENERNLSASDYNYQVYGLGLKAERPNRIFKWKKISLHEYNNISSNTMVYGVDWGIVDPMGIVEVKYYDGALYLKELNYLSENEQRAKMSHTQLRAIQNSDEGMIMNLFTEKAIGKDKVIVCDNNRPNKIIALRRGGWEYAVSVGGKPKINDGISILLDMPVYYTSCSKNIEMEQENYSWELDRHGVETGRPVDLFNHLIDAVRYVVDFLRKEGIIKKV